jgi:hypothetical protein
MCGQPGRFWQLVRRIIKPWILVVMLLLLMMFAEVVREMIRIKGNKSYESFLS